MNGKKPKRLATISAATLPKILILAVFFLGGILAGQVILPHLPPAVGSELRQYLSDYVRLERSEEQLAWTLLSTLILYLRYPVLAFLLGFASIGVIVLPVTAMVYGLFLSFSVCCFTAAFGADGVFLAAAVSGIRCLVTLPCFFVLASASLEMSMGVAALSFGRGHRISPVIYGKACWMRLCTVLLCLSIGMCVDLLVSPWLLSAALERII